MARINLILWLHGILIGSALAFILLYYQFLGYTTRYLRTVERGEMCNLQQLQEH